ncbi:MAG TPA: single-stranded DNA-binding protein [Bacilli bacterium]|nr:single-stranded DNA-binding protein [Bacilli bacterium]
MLNQVVLVGRLTDNVEVNNTENDKKVSSICIAVQRAYKNVSGEYETDFIKCILWNGIAENTAEYCKKGDVIGIKGRIQTSTYTDENDKKHYTTEVVAEKVTFLSSKNKEA